MNFTDLENAWDQQTLAGKMPPLNQLRQKLIDEIAQRRRRVSRVLGVITFVFVTGLAVEVVAHFAAIKTFNTVTLAASFVRSAFYCGVLWVALRSVRRTEREATAMGETILACMHGSLASLEGQMRDCRLLLWSLPAWLAGSAIVASVKFFSGNLPATGAIFEIGIAVVFTAAIAATVLHYYRKELIARRNELRRQIAVLQKAA